MNNGFKKHPKVKKCKHIYSDETSKLSNESTNENDPHNNYKPVRLFPAGIIQRKLKQ